MNRPSQRARLILGLMSGTSADGINVALVRVLNGPATGGPRPQLQNFATFPIPTDIRAAILRVAEGASTTSGGTRRDLPGAAGAWAGRGRLPR